MPKVVVAQYAGVCFGVRRALELLEKALEEGRSQNRPVVMLGPLIHNPRVIGQYAAAGVHTVAAIDTKDNEIAVIRSHGITGEEESLLAGKKNLTIVDTTCPFVKKIHRIVREYSQKGFAVAVLGDAAHSEVQGITSRITGPYAVIHPKEINEARTVVEALFSQCGSILLVAQTTMMPPHFNELCAIARQVKDELPGRELICENTVCDATYQRQTAAEKLAQESAAMVVLGGKNSSNTAKLFQIVSAICPTAFWVESPEELDAPARAALHKAETIGLAAGASTPDDQIEELRKMLEAL